MTPLQHHERRLANGLSIQAELMMDLLSEMMADGLGREMMACNHLAVYREIGSPATMHRAMADLVKAKYVKMEKSDKDSRAKTCTLTKKGLDYLSGEQPKAT